MTTHLSDKIKFDFNKPNFQQQFGDKKGTISEKRQEREDKSNQTADIINASANGLDSVGGIISLFMGNKTPTTSQESLPPPPPQKKTNPLIWVGGGTVVLLLIILLMTSKNGKKT